MVQHRAPLGLWDRRRRTVITTSITNGRALPIESAYEHPQRRLLHSVGRRRSRQQAGSWIFGCARRASSNTARARDQFLENCAATARGSPADALGADELPQIGDRAAGAIKSGGTTRRAAKMVIVDIATPTSKRLSTGRWSRAEGRRPSPAPARRPASEPDRTACRRAPIRRRTGAEARDPPPSGDDPKTTSSGSSVRPPRMLRDRFPQL